MDFNYQYNAEKKCWECSLQWTKDSKLRYAAALIMPDQTQDQILRQFQELVIRMNADLDGR